MTEDEVRAFIQGSLEGVETTEAFGYTFFFYGAERMTPFATLSSADNEFDRVSQLDRPGVYRLNIGVGRTAYRSLFGTEVPRLGPDGVVSTGHDFTALDELLPHPVYAPQWWVSVLTPSEETFARVRFLLTGAHSRAAKRARRLPGR
jgi:hypothetical protein